VPPGRSERRTHGHFSGCLLGGAVGDALGAPVEFLSLHQIRTEYGPAGITDYDHAYGRRGAITDDTQMTLFTAEGVLRAEVRLRQQGIGDPANVLHHAYVRWLHTQGERSESPFSKDQMDGWLIAVKRLHARRAPGSTCLSALSGATMGTIGRPLNDSKGCGGVMRVAPIGLAAADEAAAFTLGCEAAAITHGHPSGYYSAGCFAAIIRNLVEGRSLPDAIDRTLRMLEAPQHTGHGECAAAIRQAVALWRDERRAPSPETVERLGGGRGGRGGPGHRALTAAVPAAVRSGRAAERRGRRSGPRAQDCRSRPGRNRGRQACAEASRPEGGGLQAIVIGLHGVEPVRLREGDDCRLQLLQHLVHTQHSGDAVLRHQDHAGLGNPRGRDPRRAGLVRPCDELLPAVRSPEHRGQCRCVQRHTPSLP
jgi:ADP-ribosylglycohydrolase